MLAVPPGRLSRDLRLSAQSAFLAPTPAQPKPNKLSNGSASPLTKYGWPAVILSAFAARRDLRLNKSVMCLNPF